MDIKRCFEPGCMLDVECSCQCTSPETYSCEQHITRHIKLPGKAHTLNQIFIEPCLGTREVILAFLTKERSKHSKLKNKILNSFSKQLIKSENDFEELIRNLDSSLEEINNNYIKIFQAAKLLKSEQDPVVRLLSLQPNEAVEKIKLMIPDNSDYYSSAKVFCDFSGKIEKIIECFIKDKFETYLDKRLAKIEKNIEIQDKTINIANKELANIKESISMLILENKKIWNHNEGWKEEIKINSENEFDLLNSQISSINEDLSIKVKETENLNNKNISTLLNLKEKKDEILKGPNDLVQEKNFRETCSSFENDLKNYDTQVLQAYQDYVNTYHQNTSIYNLLKIDDKTNLAIYDTEGERKEIKILETPNPLNYTTCITQIPNGKLFCCGIHPRFGDTLIIDENFKVQVLPSRHYYYFSSAIYFNKNVYCFGGSTLHGSSSISRKFDLEENRWIDLAPMPQDDSNCSILIFNQDILISRWEYKTILRYSIDKNSFTKIPYEFSGKKMKILINTERPYLIECKGNWIYESEIGSDTAWRRLGRSKISLDARQVYCSYNKGRVYIGCFGNLGSENDVKYFKFDLNSKKVTQLF